MRFIRLALALTLITPVTAHANEALDFWLHPYPTVRVPMPPPSRTTVQKLVTTMAHEIGVPPRIAHGVVVVESRYNCRAYNRSSGATGIMQTLPATARSMGVHGNLHNCQNGLRAGLRYLKRIIKNNGVNCSAVSLYERGEAARPRCTKYGQRVMAIAARGF